LCNDHSARREKERERTLLLRCPGTKRRLVGTKASWKDYGVGKVQPHPMMAFLFASLSAVWMSVSLSLSFLQSKEANKLYNIEKADYSNSLFVAIATHMRKEAGDVASPRLKGVRMRRLLADF